MNEEHVRVGNAQVPTLLKDTIQIRNALLNGPLGFGGAPLGNMFCKISDDEGDSARTCSYSILQAPFPVSGYLYTLRVQEVADGNRSRVEWSGRFTPEGVSNVEASRLVRGIFEDGLKALAIRFT